MELYLKDTSSPAYTEITHFVPEAGWCSIVEWSRVCSISFPPHEFTVVFNLSPCICTLKELYLSIKFLGNELLECMH